MSRNVFGRMIMMAMLVVSLGLMSACATIVTSPKAHVPVRSTPEGAKVLIDGEEVGTTPTTVSVTRRKTHNLRIELDGYLPFETMLSKRLSGWMFGNTGLLIFAPVGMVVDFVTGAVYAIVPDEVSTTLTPSQLSSTDGAIDISLVEAPPENAVLIGMLIRAE